LPDGRSPPISVRVRGDLGSRIGACGEIERFVVGHGGLRSGGQGGPLLLRSGASDSLPPMPSPAGTPSPADEGGSPTVTRAVRGAVSSMGREYPKGPDERIEE